MGTAGKPSLSLSVGCGTHTRCPHTAEWCGVGGEDRAGWEGTLYTTYHCVFQIQLKSFVMATIHCFDLLLLLVVVDFGFMDTAATKKSRLQATTEVDHGQ